VYTRVATGHCTVVGCKSSMQLKSRTSCSWSLRLELGGRGGALWHVRDDGASGHLAARGTLLNNAGGAWPLERTPSESNRVSGRLVGLF
jgi:hypothetical protein